jgi:phosphoribosylformylglycinamidine cyclo-ligase
MLAQCLRLGQKDLRQPRAASPAKRPVTSTAASANEVRFGAARLGISSDGIGTKIEVAERVDRFDTLGYDLVAMTADDLIVGGFVPTNLSNIIDVNTLSYDVIDELMRGLHDACNFAGKSPSRAGKLPSWATASAAGRGPA